MRLYRVHYYDDGSQGFSWHPSKREAEQAVARYVRDNAAEPETGDDYDDMYRRKFAPERPTIDPVDVELTKAGLLRLLAVYATHPDNG